jgi:small-conductance mechanosensitive channel
VNLLGLELTLEDLRAWLEAARDFALPRLVQTVGVAVLAGALYWVARRILLRLEGWLSAKTAFRYDEIVARLARRCLLLSVAFWAVWRVVTLWELAGTGRLVVALWIVAVTLPVSAFVSDVLHILEERVVPRTDTTLDDTALPLLNKIARFLVVAAGVLMALEYLGIDVTPLLAGAGVAGLAVSLAAKDTLSNVIAGILLILDRPFHVGDRIEMWNAPAETGSWGDVIEIGLRATKIRNPDNVIVVVPNNEIMRRDIVNYTASGPDIRLRIPLGISYDADVELAKRLILEVARDASGVQQDPAPKVIVRSFGESSVNLELRVWISDARRRRDIADEVTGRVKTAFDEHGVEIPYPKRDIYVRTAGDDRPSEERPAATLGSGSSDDTSASSAPGESTHSEDEAPPEDVR